MQITLVVTFMIGVDYLTESPFGLYLGVTLFMAYAVLSRELIARHHRRGMRAVKARRWEAAALHFEESYRFFLERAWIDRWRALILLSGSAASYREMALVNLAFCRSQMGDGVASLEAYKRALSEFPDSPIAQSALAMLRSAGGRNQME